MFVQRVAQGGQKTAVRYKESESPYQGMSWQQYGQLVQEIASGLAAYGLQPGGTVAIFSQGTYLWVASDFATMSNGAKSVPIYPTSSQADLQAIMANSEASIILVQDEHLLNKVLDVSE